MVFRSTFWRQTCAFGCVLFLACGGTTGEEPASKPVSVQISPATVSLAIGAQQTFQATVTGTTNTAVTWSVEEGALGGSITSGGVYTAPASPGTYHVKATSVADPSKSASATVTVVTPPAGTTVYRVIQGHDGDPDPDDNLAQLVGLYAIKRNMEANPGRVEMVGCVYGDTTEARKKAMRTGSYKGYGNYRYFLAYSSKALKEIYGDANVHDCVTQTWNFNATSVAQLTSGGRMIYNAIKSAIENADPTKNYRIVYSAGGGHNAAWEAICLLRYHGKTDAEIMNHFIIIQHSQWNQDNCNEPGVLDGTKPFFQRINDQNGTSGRGKTPPSDTVSIARTSQTFYNAYWVAWGPDDTLCTKDDPNIDMLYFTTDASDSGSHRYGSTSSLLDANWNKRNNNDTKINFSSWTLSAIAEAICN